MNVPKHVQTFLIQAQRNELTEHIIYKKLAKIGKNNDNKKILNQISEEEMKHHDIWKKYTNLSVKPNMKRVYAYVWTSRILGLSFGIKLMEKGEKNAQVSYDKIGKYIKEAISIQQEEEKHEKKLIAMINDKGLDYIGSIVLGLNDALVELTGVLAGLTLGLQDPKLIGVVGLITGVSASLSMGASEYLSTKAEGNHENAFTSSVYTWTAYFITVILLILPFLFLENPFIALPITLGIAVTIIAIFNRYTAIAKGHNFKHRFWEMVGISLGVAIISFGIGLLVRNVFGLEV